MKHVCFLVHKFVNLQHKCLAVPACCFYFFIMLLFIMQSIHQCVFGKAKSAHYIQATFLIFQLALIFSSGIWCLSDMAQMARHYAHAPSRENPHPCWVTIANFLSIPACPHAANCAHFKCQGPQSRPNPNPGPSGESWCPDKETNGLLWRLGASVVMSKNPILRFLRFLGGFLHTKIPREFWYFVFFFLA